MTEEQIELARQVLATGRFEWRPGMRFTDDTGGVLGRYEGGAPPAANVLPDLSDPATAGALVDFLDGVTPIVDIAKEGDEWIVAVETAEGLKGWIGATLGEATCWAFLSALEDGLSGEDGEGALA